MRIAFRVVIAVTLIVLIVLSVVAYQAWRQRTIVAELQGVGLKIEMTDEESWLPQMLDVYYLQRVKKVRSGTAIDLEGSHISDVTPLAQFANLGMLELAGCPVADITPLAELTKLFYLDLSHTPVEDIAPLANTKQIVYLNLSHTRVEDLSALNQTRNLETLILTNTHVADLAPLAGLRNLQTLGLSGTQIDDVSKLSALKNLRLLLLTRTAVTDEQVQILQRSLPSCAIFHSYNVEQLQRIMINAHDEEEATDSKNETETSNLHPETSGC